jgi:hypothetical protein
MSKSLTSEDFPRTGSKSLPLDDWLDVQHVIYTDAQKIYRAEQKIDHFSEDRFLTLPNCTHLGPQVLGVRTWLLTLPDLGQPRRRDGEWRL